MNKPSNINETKTKTKIKNELTQNKMQPAKISADDGVINGGNDDDDDDDYDYNDYNNKGEQCEKKAIMRNRLNKYL